MESSIQFFYVPLNVCYIIFMLLSESVDPKKVPLLLTHRQTDEQMGGKKDEPPNGQN